MSDDFLIMLTYDLKTEKNSKIPLYKELYEKIKADIFENRLKPNEKLPSKRTLSENLKISTITVENSYNQLLSEGLIYSKEKKGYFVSEINNFSKVNIVQKKISIPEKKEKNYDFDFSSNNSESRNFPFSIWAKLSRKVLSENQEEVLKVSPGEGIFELRKAICNHLSNFRGMNVDEKQIIIGAGTEYLYGILIKLLGREKTYCIENPGWTKLQKIYESNGVKCVSANLDENGIKVDEIKAQKADIAHISANHHFPTGITMPPSRRYELLAWANESENRYIIEDDYDSEFRQKGRPVSPLFNIDAFEKVIFINTFSKSLSPTIRIAYMVLSEHLAKKFYEELSFFSCTVSTFEQYTLSAFISEGYFEKHINRMRLYYGRKREKVLEILNKNFSKDECNIIENDSGLHLVLELKSSLSDSQLKKSLEEKSIKISTIQDYSLKKEGKNNSHQFILNYSNINLEKLEKAVKILKEIVF